MKESGSGMKEPLRRRSERVHGELRAALGPQGSSGHLLCHKWGHTGQSVQRTGMVWQPPEVTVSGNSQEERKEGPTKAQQD